MSIDPEAFGKMAKAIPGSGAAQDFIAISLLGAIRAAQEIPGIGRPESFIQRVLSRYSRGAEWPWHEAEEGVDSGK